MSGISAATGRVIEVVVERSGREHAANAAGRVRLDPALMARQGLKPGDLVRLSTFRRELLARLDTPTAAERNTGAIRLDRFQRQALQARLYSRVELEPAPERAVKRLRLQPAVDLTTAGAHHIEQHLKEELVRERAPVATGALVFLHFHHSVAGTLYQAVEVEGGPGVVADDTDVVLDAAPQGFDKRLRLALTFEDVGGLTREIKLVKELLQLPLQAPGVYRQLGIAPARGMILYGPPGTGKTLLGRALASEVDAQFYYINGPEIVSSTYGESEGNLRRIFGEATHHAPSVVCIDELDAIALKRGESGSHADTRLATQLLALMDGMAQVEGVVVIGTTNRIEALDVAFRRPGRFDRELYIGPPDAAGRLQILQIHTREMPLDKPAADYLPQLAQDTPGFVGADLLALCREAGLGALRRTLPDPAQALSGRWDPETLRVQPDDFINARRHSRPSAGRATLVAVPEHGYERVGGLAPAKAQLHERVIARLQTGAGLDDGVILAGPPGSGKSVLGRATAKEAGVNLIAVAGPELFSKWLGESEQALRQVFKLARELAPSVLFFDQLDALAPVRGRTTGSWTTERVVHQLAAELDELRGAPVAVLAATNRLDLVDPALLQPGRFGTCIMLDAPALGERAEILALDLAISAKQRRRLAGRTAGWSGAEVRALAAFLARALSKPGTQPGMKPEIQPEMQIDKLFAQWSRIRPQPRSKHKRRPS